MQLEWRSVSSLRPRANNPRTHSIEQVTQIAASITKFGFTNPVLIEDDGLIVAGHGRCRAAQQLGLEQVPCIVLTGLTPEEVRALVIADNQLALNAGWDETILTAELAALAQSQFDLQVLGFDDEVLAQYLGETQEPTPEEEERAQLLARAHITIEEPTTEVQSGDVWTLGRHVLIVADVVRGHSRWRGFLTGDEVFAPFAGPFAFATEAAAEGGPRIVVVQPDHYIAGHIIDRFVEWFPSEPVAVAREDEAAPI